MEMRLKLPDFLSKGLLLCLISLNMIELKWLHRRFWNLVINKSYLYAISSFLVRKIINQFFLLDCIRSNNKRRVTLKISAARELNENYWLPTNPITAVSVNTSHTPILHPAGIFFLVRAVCTHTVTPTDSNFCVIFRRIFWRIIFHIQYLRCRAVVRVAGLWCLYIFEHTFIIIRHLWVWIKYLRAVTSLVLQLIQIFSILCNQEETIKKSIGNCMLISTHEWKTVLQ